MKTPVVFVNSLTASGYLNGVVNLAFETAQFIPVTGADGVRVEAQPEITANLRMDLFCAQQIYSRLGEILEANKVAPKPEDIN